MTWLKHLFWEREREGAYGCAICCVSVESTSQPSKKDELATFVKTKGGGGGICLKSTRLRSETCANGPPSRELASRSFHTTYLPILVLFRCIAFLSSPPSRIPLYTWPTLPTLSPLPTSPNYSPLPGIFHHLSPTRTTATWWSQRAAIRYRTSLHDGCFLPILLPLKPKVSQKQLNSPILFFLMRLSTNKGTKGLKMK